MGVNNYNWKYTNSTWFGPNTNLTVGNNGNIGKTPLAPSGQAPYQDLDASGNVTGVGWHMPYPYDFPCTNYDGTVTIKNTTGRMDSLAELGYINTGAVSFSGTTGTDTNGVPYRTLRLEPSQGKTATTVPDWALLDLFALPPPATETNFPYQPYGATNIASNTNVWNTNSAGLINGGNVWGGRINLNGNVYPFTNTTTRITPLIALLSGATNAMMTNTISTATAGTMATNILNATLATNSYGSSLSKIYFYGEPYDSITNGGLYTHIGELAEIKGMADSGKASEGNLFEPLAETTVSGNVFTIYTVGQALQQTPSGNIVVNGEKRYQATVERIPTVPMSATGTGLFRVVVVRELTP
jgi:hypothetical protein